MGDEWVQINKKGKVTVGYSTREWDQIGSITYGSSANTSITRVQPRVWQAVSRVGITN